MFYNDNATYPLYNIEKLTIDSDEGEYHRITLVVAGFLKEELNISAQSNHLNIVGKKISQDNKSLFLHKEISHRGFDKSFELSDSMVIQNSVLKMDYCTYILRHTLNKSHHTKIKIMEENDFIAREF